MNPLALLSGIVIGFVQGLIAGGGSVLGVPALIYVVGVKARICHRRWRARGGDFGGRRRRRLVGQRSIRVPASITEKKQKK